MKRVENYDPIQILLAAGQNILDAENVKELVFEGIPYRKSQLFSDAKGRCENLILIKEYLKPDYRLKIENLKEYLDNRR